LSSARSGREIDTRDGLRALGITAVVANHAFAAPVHGGLNLLLLVSGIAFAQLCFGGRGRSALVATTMRFARPLAVWSVVLCLFWFAVFGRFEPAELLMVGNWFTTERVSKFPIWYTQVMLQMLLGIVALLALPGMLVRVRRAPVVGAVAWLAGAAALAVVAQLAVDTDHLADKLPHLHAWNFVLGWLFWAVLYAREASGADRALLTACCVPLMLVMFLGLGVPGAEARVWVAIPATVLLIWAPVLRLARPLAQPVLLIGQAVLSIFFLHYPFLLAIRNLLGEHMQPLALQSLQFAAGIVGPVLVWAMVTAAQRTLAHGRMRRGKTEGARAAGEQVVSA
jgi:peptidoglycan/LPS O-acetylase OafA/YrhL